MTKNNFLFYMYLNSRLTCLNQKESWNHYGGVDNKTQLFPKIILALSRWLGNSHKKNLPPVVYCCSFVPMNEGS